MVEMLLAYSFVSTFRFILKLSWFVLGSPLTQNKDASIGDVFNESSQVAEHQHFTGLNIFGARWNRTQFRGINHADAVVLSVSRKRRDSRLYQSLMGSRS